MARNNNQFYVFLIFIVLLISLSNVEAKQLGPYISASAESITPFPVEPGQDFTLQLRIYNDGEESTKVKVYLEENDIFSLTGKDDDFDKKFSVCPGCSFDNVYYFSTSIDAVSGEYTLIFKIEEDDVTHEAIIPVTIIGKPDLILDARLLNDSVKPDESFDVNFTVRNVGTGVARKIKLLPQSDIFVMKNANLIYIEEIFPEDEFSDIFEFMVDNSEDPGAKKLDFDIEYTDEKSNEYSLDQSLGFKILNDVDLNLAAVIADNYPILIGNRVEITVRVENLGEGDAENVVVIFNGTGFRGSHKSYIGKIEEDEDAPAVFNLFPYLPGVNDVQIIVEYKDDLGMHKLIEGIEIEVEATDYLVWVFLVGVLAVAGYLGFLYYKRYTKRKKIEEGSDEDYENYDRGIVKKKGK